MRPFAVKLLPRTSPISRRCFHCRAHTLYSPTPTSLQSFLSCNPVSSTSTTLYVLSTSLTHLPDLLSSLQRHLPSSIGSFSSSPPNSPPSLSIATFDHGQIFRSDLSGRPPAEVGHWQRASHEGYAEDRKGSEAGDVEATRKEEGWAGLWRGETEVGPITDLEGVKWVLEIRGCMR